MGVSPFSSPPERDRLESRIAVRLHAHDFVELCEVARAHDRSAAAGVRRAVRAHLARERREPDALHGAMP